jgi:hypothetical protein
MGWAFDDGTRPIRIYSPATIKSLWKHGLLGANFDDARGVGPCSQANLVKNLDGARFEHSPEVHELQVWTNMRGRMLLQEIQKDTGILPDSVGTACH